YEQALPIHRATGNRLFESITLSDLGNVVTHMGEPDRALQYYRRAQAISREMGDKPGEATALLNKSAALQKMRNYRKALETAGMALRPPRDSGDRYIEAGTLHYLAMAEWKLNRTAKADEHFKGAISLFESLRAGLGGYQEAKSSFLANNLIPYYDS